MALMPDAHKGLGSTVGSVVPTRGAIIPSCVGVDIGCGMVASETTLTAADLLDSLDRLMPLVSRRIPAGVGKGHEHPVAGGALAALGRPRTELSGKQERTAATQFGTLGSGNHFAEVCLDERGHVWTVLHSGSRGIGNQLAVRAIDEAKGLMKERFIHLLSSRSAPRFARCSLDWRTRTSPISSRASRRSRPMSPTCSGRRPMPWAHGR